MARLLKFVALMLFTATAANGQSCFYVDRTVPMSATGGMRSAMSIAGTVTLGVMMSALGAEIRASDVVHLPHRRMMSLQRKTNDCTSLHSAWDRAAHPRRRALRGG
jgi:hypothetical protein